MDFALENRVLLVQAPSGVGLDSALGGMPFQSQLHPLVALEEQPENLARLAAPRQTC